MRADKYTNSSINNNSINSPFRKLFKKSLKSPNYPPNQNNQNKCDNSDDDVAIQRAFNYFDENGDGKISARELQSCVRAALSKEEAEMAVRWRDEDEDEEGLLCLEDFGKLIRRESGVEEELRGVFGMYAEEGTGCITAESLRRMLCRLGESRSVGECERMISEFDENGDGVLDFDEFKTMMTQ